MFIRRWNSSSVWSNNGFTISIPALLTSVSMPPKAAVVASTARAKSAAEVTSQRTDRAIGPRASAVFPLASAWRSTPVTIAPKVV